MHENYDLEQLMELVQTRQFRRLRELLVNMNEVDIAEFLDGLGPEETVLVFRLLPKEVAAEVFTELEDSDDQERLINALSDKELREVLDELYLDDTVDLIEDMPANLVSRILRNTDSTTRSQINQLLNYPKDSAGSIMTTEYVYLHPNATVEESFARIRKVGMDKETIYTCYVTQNKVLLGVVTVKRLLLSPYETKIRDIMETNVRPLAEDPGPYPFATLADLAAGGTYRQEDSYRSNQVERRSDWLAPVIIEYREYGSGKTEAGKRFQGGLTIEYYETAAPWLAREIGREYLSEARRSKHYKEIPLKGLDLDWSAAYQEIFPTVLLQKGSRIMRITFYQTADHTIPVEEWAGCFAAHFSDQKSNP